MINWLVHSMRDRWSRAFAVVIDTMDGFHAVWEPVLVDDDRI